MSQLHSTRVRKLCLFFPPFILRNLSYLDVYKRQLLNRAQIDYELKERLFDLLCMQKEPLAILRECASLPLPSGLLEALMEVF